MLSKKQIERLSTQILAEHTRAVNSPDFKAGRRYDTCFTQIIKLFFGEKLVYPEVDLLNHAN